MTNNTEEPTPVSRDETAQAALVLNAAVARFAYAHRIKHTTEVRRVSKLRARVSWPNNLAELAGANTERYEQLLEVLTHITKNLLSDDVILRAQPHTPPLEVSRLMTATLTQALSTEANRPPPEVSPVGVSKTDGGAYLQWIPLDGLEKGTEISVPLEAAAKQVTVRVHSAGAPVPMMDVRLQVSDTGYVRGMTNADGKCVLGIPRRGVRAFISVTVRPSNSYWSAVEGIDVAGKSGPFELDIELEPLNPNIELYLGPVLGQSAMDFGAGVSVGIVDSGWTEHESLPNYVPGTCTVPEDPTPGDVHDTIGHATMIAGIIGGQGDGSSTVRGIAPGVKMIGFRAFAKGAIRTDGVAISKGIRQAVEAGCDIVNISVGGIEEMPTAEEEIQYAWDHGVVCIVAAGNLSRQQVLYPARYERAIAVSAMGRKASYPELSLFSLCETSDSGTDASHYLPNFTNVGAEVAFCAPGVGIVSTFLGNTLHSSKGTSFAAPIVVGLLARLLSLPQGVPTLKMPRTAERSAAMKTLLETSPLLFGFAVAGSEGSGCPRS